MSTQPTRSETESQALALLGRLHVLLRRERNRITDIEYMRVSPDYCRHILDLAAESAGADMAELVHKLRALYFGPAGLFLQRQAEPLMSRLEAWSAQRRSPARTPESAAPPTEALDQAVDRAYIGRLR